MISPINARFPATLDSPKSVSGKYFYRADIHFIVFSYQEKRMKSCRHFSLSAMPAYSKEQIVYASSAYNIRRKLLHIQGPTNS
jgi:hypothetical protein